MIPIPSNEITDSIKETLKRRLITPLYGVFVISWLVFHWEFVYTAFFVDQEKILITTGLLKNDYLTREFFNFSEPKFYILWIIPFILTWLIIWFFPKWFSIPAFEKDVEYKTAKRKIEIAAQRELEEANVQKLEVVTRRKKQEKEVKETQKEIEKLDPSILFRTEFNQFKASMLYQKFKYILDSVYKHNGSIRVRDMYGMNNIFEIPKDILAYSHTNDLVVLDKTKEKIELTEKGKFFVKEISIESPQLLSN